jgi:hypothetical protein
MDEYADPPELPLQARRVEAVDARLGHSEALVERVEVGGEPPNAMRMPIDSCVEPVRMPPQMMKRAQRLVLSTTPVTDAALRLVLEVPDSPLESVREHLEPVLLATAMETTAVGMVGECG